MSAYLKSTFSSWIVRQRGPVKDLWYGYLRPFYMSRAARKEAREWKKMGLGMLDDKDVRDRIGMSLSEGKGLSLAKIGATEYFMLQWLLGHKISNSRLQDLYHLSGVFPCDSELFRRFGEVYWKATRDLDVLGLWNGKGEPETYRNLDLRAEVTPQATFSGEFEKIAAGGNTSWFPEMAGRNVLVISSFAESINERSDQVSWERYWGDRFPWIGAREIRAIPFPYGFERKTQNKYRDSLELLESFQAEHSEAMERCDILLAGCGAYAIPLLSWAKSKRKVAVHLGGAVQLLFGIKGGRWDGIPDLYNEHWIRPPGHLVPESADRVEQSCYW